jgi:hypothetical protein
MNDSAIQTQDVFQVRSRVSWGAIFAGTFVALTVYVLLSVLGLALGLSVAPQASGDALASSAGIWAIVTGLLALFSGGCVTTRCTAGETRTEAVIYGVILWGVMLVLTLWITGSILRTGFTAALGTANVAARAAGERPDWDRISREANLSQQQVDELRAALPSTNEVRTIASETAWWSLAGLALSLLASVAGAFVGAGPTMMLGGLSIRRTTVVSGSPTH